LAEDARCEGGAASLGMVPDDDVATAWLRQPDSGSVHCRVHGADDRRHRPGTKSVCETCEYLWRLFRQVRELGSRSNVQVARDRVRRREARRDGLRQEDWRRTKEHPAKPTAI